MKRNALFAAIAAVVVSTTAWAGPGMGMGYGPGMGMGMGGMGMGRGTCMEENLAALGLTAEQRDKIATIQSETSRKQLALMDSMHELRTKTLRKGEPDGATYAAMADLRKQMATVSREGRERTEAVLTPEQRAQWRPGWRGAAWRG